MSACTVGAGDLMVMWMLHWVVIIIYHGAKLWMKNI